MSRRNHIALPGGSESVRWSEKTGQGLFPSRRWHGALGRQRTASVAVDGAERRSPLCVERRVDTLGRRGMAKRKSSHVHSVCDAVAHISVVSTHVAPRNDLLGVSSWKDHLRTAPRVASAFARSDPTLAGPQVEARFAAQHSHGVVPVTC